MSKRMSNERFSLLGTMNWHDEGRWAVKFELWQSLQAERNHANAETARADAEKNNCVWLRTALAMETARSATLAASVKPTPQPEVRCDYDHRYPTLEEVDAALKVMEEEKKE